jgi:hypothetical protein
MPATIEIVSIGQLAAWIQASPSRIRKAAEALGIQPAYRINGVEHFDEADGERICKFLNAEQPS